MKYRQLNIEGKTCEEIAIEFLIEHEPPDGYFLGFSGGKDSIVIKDLAIKSGVKFISYYSATGIDPPELCRYIKRYHPDVIWLRPKNNFYAEILNRSPPTKWRRWCCDFLKKDPAKNIDLQHRIMGIRAEESPRRASRPNPHYFKKQWNYKPIFNWRGWEVWDYIERNNLPYCSLYDEGFDRIGCIICPFLCYPHSKKLIIHRERWPKQYSAFERILKQYFEKNIDKMTYAGISRVKHPDWIGWEIIDMGKTPAIESVMDFYDIEFWEPLKLQYVSSDVIAWPLYDFSVTSGILTAVRAAQRVLCVPDDGMVGPKTLSALNTVEYRHFKTEFTFSRIRFYLNIARRDRSQRNFFFHWITRSMAAL